MTLLTALLATYVIVFLINLVPAFMPPTWSILAFFRIHYDLPLLPLAVGGAVAASSGRLVLALVSRRWGRLLLSPERREGLHRLGEWLEERARWAAPLAVLIYSFGPIPSNELFIAAGLTGMRLTPVVGAFFVGRLISYSLWVATAEVLVDRLEDIFARHVLNVGVLALELLAIGVLVLFTRIDWPRLLHLPGLKPAATKGQASGETKKDQRDT